MEEQLHNTEGRRARRGRLAEPQLAEALAANPIDKDGLLRVVGDICSRFSSRTGVRRLNQALLDAFGTLAEKQKSLCGTNADEAAMVAVSCAMRVIVDAQLSYPDLDAWNRFVSLYRAWVAVRAAEFLHQEPEVKAWLGTYLQEALAIGRGLCVGGGLDGIPFRHDEPQHTFSRMATICEAITTQALVGPGEEAGVRALGDLCRKNMVHHEEYTEARALYSQLNARASEPTFRIETCEDVIGRLCAHPFKDLLCLTFKTLKNVRSSRSRNVGDSGQVHALSEVMFRISSAMCAFPISEKNLLGAFHDRYDLYDSVHLDSQLLQRSDIRVAVKASLQQAYELGCRLLHSEGEGGRLKPSDEWANFHSRFGEVCRAHLEYEICPGKEELRAVLERGVNSLQKASEGSGPPDPDHLKFNLRRLAECLRGLGRFEEAAKTLEPLFTLPGMEDRLLWDARRVAADIAVTQAWVVGDEGPERRASFLAEAEQHALAAGRVWESTNLREFVTEKPNNWIIHSLLAWVYFNQGDWKAAAAQAEFFLRVFRRGDPEDANFKARTANVLAQSLINLGKLCEAEAAIQKLLAYEPDPRFQVLPLAALLRIQKQLDAPQAEIGPTVAHFLNVCVKAGIPIALDRLSPEVLEVLSSPEVMVRRARAMLDAGRAEEVLKLLPIMARATWLTTGADNPVLLTLLAEADRQVGKPENLDRALRTLNYVTTIDSSPKTRSIAWTQLGKVHEKRGDDAEALKAFSRAYQTHGRHPTALVGCCRCLRRLGKAAEAVDLLRLHRGPDKVWLGIIIQEMTALLDEPGAQAALENEISRTSEPWFLELIQRAMPIDAPVPAPIMAAAHQRLTQPDLAPDLQRSMLKLLSRELAQSYFAAEPGGQEFESLAHTSAREALDAALNLRRDWLFSLLTSCRSAVLLGTLHRYVEAARKALEPLLEDEPEASAPRDWSACLEQMNALLLNRLPEQLRPSSYGGTDSVDVRQSVQDLLYRVYPKLLDHTRKGQRFDFAVQEDPLNSRIFDWLNVKQAISRLFDFETGPLAALVSQTEDWHIQVTVAGRSIDALLSSQMRRDSARSAAEEMLGKLEVGTLKVDVNVSASLEIHLAVHAQLDPPAPRASLLELTPLFDYLDKMQADVLGGGRTDHDFFTEAERLFRAAGDEVFLPTPLEWSKVLRQRYDQEFARTLLWLADEPPNSPTAVLHNLKGRLQNCIAAAGADDAFVQQVGRLREQARQAFSDVVRLAFGHLEEGPPASDLVGIAQELIAARHPVADGIEIVEKYPDDPLVAVHPLPLRWILSNLLDNALSGARRFGAGQVQVTVREVVDDTSGANALVTVSNPYNPNLPDDLASTGLGCKTAEVLVKQNKGQFQSIGDKGAQIWTTRVWLPVAA